MKNTYEEIYMILTLVISFVGIVSAILDAVFFNDDVYIIFKLKII